MSASSLFVYLLQKADDPRHADRAWSLMQPWTPALYPSQFEEQVQQAIEATRYGTGEGTEDPVAVYLPKCTCTRRRGRHAKGCPARDSLVGV